MKFLCLTILAVAACTDAAYVKRGAQQTAYANVPSQKQYYQQPSPVQYQAPQQVEYQPQAYSQAAAPAKVAYRPNYSFASDVSSFQYASPVVTYNNLGLLSQVIGRGVQGQAPVAVKAAAPQVAYQPAQPAYSAPAPAQRLTQSYVPQQYTQAQPEQYQVAQTYSSQAPQTFTQSNAQYSGQTQAYTAQSSPQLSYAQAPQVSYQQAPQYYSAPQALKQYSQ